MYAARNLQGRVHDSDPKGGHDSDSTSNINRRTHTPGKLCGHKTFNTTEILLPGFLLETEIFF